MGITPFQKETRPDSPPGAGPEIQTTLMTLVGVDFPRPIQDFLRTLTSRYHGPRLISVMDMAYVCPSFGISGVSV